MIPIIAPLIVFLVFVDKLDSSQLSIDDKSHFAPQSFERCQINSAGSILSHVGKLDLTFSQVGTILFKRPLEFAGPAA